MILGIDTSLGTAVGIVEADGGVRAQVASAETLKHAEVVGSLLIEALEQAGATSLGGDPDARISYVAAGMGPGPFTGLRIGIAAARAFALGRDIRVVPVVSHDAVALERLLASAIDGDDDEERFAVVTDARRREFAYSVYEGLDDDGLPIRAAGPTLVPRDEIDDALAAAEAVRRDATAVSGSMLALAAARAVAAGRVIAPRDPLYLRSPDVTVPAERKRVGT